MPALRDKDEKLEISTSPTWKHDCNAGIENVTRSTGLGPAYSRLSWASLFAVISVPVDVRVKAEVLAFVLTGI